MKKAMAAAFMVALALQGCAGILDIDEVTDAGNEIVKLYCKATPAEQGVIKEKIMFKFEAGQVSQFDVTCAP
ncbi:MAG: hypothetical protein ACE5G5_14045 [Candidatus Methylomirabilales bacterium]